MTDNLHEEIAKWQEDDEIQNLKIIEAHELQTTDAKDIGSLFKHELNRRQTNEQPK